MLCDLFVIIDHTVLRETTNHEHFRLKLPKSEEISDKYNHFDYRQFELFPTI